MAGIVSASVQGRIALGSRAGARVRRVGPDSDGGAVTSRGPRQAHLEGFDLHANVWVHANDRAGLERLCRYLLRPPLAHDRLRLRADGRVLVDLKTAWHDGTTQLVFEPIELLEKLAAITPRPEINLVLYHGVLAPNARWRRHVVTYERGPTEAPHQRSDTPDAPGPDPVDAAPAPGRPRYWTWAALMRRAFELDVLACPRCGGRMRLIATVEDPAIIRRILAHLGLWPPPERPGPAPPPDPFSSGSGFPPIAAR